MMEEEAKAMAKADDKNDKNFPFHSTIIHTFLMMAILMTGFNVNPKNSNC
jgi:hypothetical protein